MTRQDIYEAVCDRYEGGMTDQEIARCLELPRDLVKDILDFEYSANVDMRFAF